MSTGKNNDNLTEAEIQVESSLNQGAEEPFKITKECIDYLMQRYLNRKFTEEIDYLQRVNGVGFLEAGLCTSISSGLKDTEERRDKRIELFDSNEKPPEEPIRFCDFVIEGLSDKIIIILCFAAVVELALGLGFGDNRKLDWIEGACIVLAVFIVVSVGSINNYNKEIEFRKIKEETASDRKIFIKRDGEWVEDKEDCLLAGDIIKIDPGMTIPCDAILVEGTAELDESAMTGEIDPINKLTLEACMERRRISIERNGGKPKNSLAHHEVESPILLSGTQVNQGDGAALLLAVGSNSENGKIRATINSNKSSSEGTPLEIKLSDLADLIGWGGLFAAIVTFVGMLLNLVIRLGIGQMEWDSKDSKIIVNIFIIPIIVLVVAIPEGLPLAVTMTLAFSIRVMLKEKCFVRRLESCETMGNAQYICTDKTGTLTQNKLKINKYFNFPTDGKDKELEITTKKDFNGKKEEYFTQMEWEILELSVACNTDTYFDKNGDEKGNKSDMAFTSFTTTLGSDIKALRQRYMKPVKGEKARIPFTSKRKKMSTLISDDSLPTGYRLLVKGGSDIVLTACDFYMKPNGEIMKMDEKMKNQILERNKEYSKLTLRNFIIAYKDIKKEEVDTFFEEKQTKDNKLRPIEESGLIMIGLFGVKDHMKSMVPESIAKCKQAQIKVIMVTGDNIDTAYAIAINCNIATHKSETILGDKFIEEIGGIICENCNRDFLGLPSKEEEEKANEKKNIKNNKDKGSEVDAISEMKKKGDKVVDCKCPRTKDEWVLKWKQDFKAKTLKESNDWKERASTPEGKEKLEKEIEEMAFKQFDEQKITVRKDVIANIDVFKTLIQTIRVVARSQPAHKYALVTGLRQLDHVVAVTGDGTNDATALSKADVGFAMNEGTDIAKEASDIVIQDSEFKTIVTAVMWGRNVFDNIRKFIQFQLTVNVSACVLVMVGASVGQQSPLTAIQMLWVNMIMDSLGSLALANEKPTERLLNRPPVGKHDFIINRKMYKHIFGQAIYQLIILFIILFSAQRWLPEYKQSWKDISYTLKKCYPEAPIYYKNELSPENMYVVSGMEAFFGNSTSLIYPANSECFRHKYFEDASSLKSAYSKIKDKEFATPHFTVLFNTFVLMQLVNEFCCRVIYDEFNIFYNIEANLYFILLWFIELGLQIVIVILTGPVFKVTKGGISPQHWGICIGFAFLTIPVNIILKFINEGEDKSEVQEGEKKEVPVSDSKGIIAKIRPSATIRKDPSRQ